MFISSIYFLIKLLIFIGLTTTFHQFSSSLYVMFILREVTQIGYVWPGNDRRLKIWCTCQSHDVVYINNCHRPGFLHFILEVYISCNFCIYMHIGPIFRLLPFGITGSNDFVQSEENTRVFRIPSTWNWSCISLIISS